MHFWCPRWLPFPCLGTCVAAARGTLCVFRSSFWISVKCRIKMNVQISREKQTLLRAPNLSFQPHLSALSQREVLQRWHSLKSLCPALEGSHPFPQTCNQKVSSYLFCSCHFSSFFVHGKLCAILKTWFCLGYGVMYTTYVWWVHMYVCVCVNSSGSLTSGLSTLKLLLYIITAQNLNQMAKV